MATEFRVSWHAFPKIRCGAVFNNPINGGEAARAERKQLLTMRRLHARLKKDGFTLSHTEGEEWVWISP